MNRIHHFNRRYIYVFYPSAGLRKLAFDIQTRLMNGLSPIRFFIKSEITDEQNQA